MASKELSGSAIFKRPMCLIGTTKDGKLQIEEDAMHEIEQIDLPLVVVAIAGLYRTGKSYLMNSLAGETKGFPLGNTTESETKGIWAWCRNHPRVDNQVLLLLDTEGLGDIAKGDTDHDNKIFTIAALLCNVLVYNMMSTFNQDAVEKLTFISEMSKNISFANSKINGDEKFGLILPTFVLCLRDFTLDIEKDGEEMTPDEYLEDCLELKPGKGKYIEKFNRPRECIRKYFPKRKCFTFDRPGSRAVMKRLESARAEELSEDFRQETEIFLRYIHSCKPKVLLSSKPVRGKMFATLATSYINAIRNGAIPDVDGAIEMVAKKENERMANAAVEEFKTELQYIELPVLQVRDFNQVYEAIQNASLASFRREAVFESDVFEKRAIDEMNKVWTVTKEKNSKLVRDHCLTQLNKIFDEVVSERGGKARYLVPGGYEIYKNDIDKMKRLFKLKMRGIEDLEVSQTLNEFMEKETNNETEILMKDRTLTAEDRQRDIEKMRKDNQEALEEQQRLHEEMLKEEKRRSEVHFRKLEMDRKSYMEREDEKLQMLMQQWEAQREYNEKQIKMMITENEKQRNEFKNELRRLKEENRIRDEEKMNRLTEEREYYEGKIDKMNSCFESERQKEGKRHEDEIRRQQQKIKSVKRKQEEKFRQQQSFLQSQCSQLQTDALQRNIDVENAQMKTETIER